MAPEQLVSSMFGRVNDFAVGPDGLYPIVNIGGRLELVACPGFVCGASPTVIGDASLDTYGGVAIDGASIFWIGPNDGAGARLMTAGLDGSNAHVLRAFPGADLLPPLRAYDGRLYFNLTPHYAANGAPAFSGQTASVAVTDGSFTLYPSLSSSEPSVLDSLDLRDGVLAIHHPPLYGNAGTSLMTFDLVTSAGAVVGSTHGAESLAVNHDATFYLESSSNTTRLYGCDNAQTQQTAVAALAGFAVAVDDTHVFFPTANANHRFTISSCDITAALAGTCTPVEVAHPANDLDLYDVRVMRVVDGALYIGTDGTYGAASVWRVAL